MIDLDKEVHDQYPTAVAEMDTRLFEFIDQWGPIHGFEHIVNAAHAYVVVRVRRENPDGDAKPCNCDPEAAP